MSLKTARQQETQIRPVTQAELDRKIEGLVVHVAAAADGDSVAERSDEAFRPRWISSAELVRRLKPFICCN